MKSTLVALGIGLLSAAASATPIQWSSGSGGNDHWYEYVSTPVDWNGAFAAANSSVFAGLQGYLATITSGAENMFVAATVAAGQLAWLGGSDAGAPVNSWTWRNGPEAGQAFTFTAWNGGEPNNCCGGEDYLQVNFGSLGGWNDHGGPGNWWQTNGYVVEYSAMAPVPEPASLALALAGLGLLATKRRRSES